VGTTAGATPNTVWAKASSALKTELGEGAFGSWVAQAAVREGEGGLVYLVTQTGIARDWIRRNAWRRICDLWAQFDPQGRTLELKSRFELESESASFAPNPPSAAVKPLSADLPTGKPVTPLAPTPEDKTRAPKPGVLGDRYTLESFVTGLSNEFAFAVARRVASWADGHFNPVVLHGPYGFGKTHLLNAVAAEAMRNAPGKKVMSITSERFLSTFVKALQDRSTAAFKDELRGADLLLIDDVQLIAGKTSSQEELFHTLMALMSEGRRVMLTADRPPSAISEMDPRLRSHLSAGLVCGIEPADRTLRLGILERKLQILARQHDFRRANTARPEVLEFLADRFTDSVRELEGALNTLVARLGEGVCAVGLDEAQAILRPHLRGGEKRVTVDDIQKATAEHFGLKQADLISERRNRAIARPRQAAMWLAKQLTTRSLPDIGRRFGGRDHTTVLHAVRRIEELKAGDPQLQRDLDTLARKLRE
jgi:chromosomal replication initiator protein